MDDAGIREEEIRLRRDSWEAERDLKLRAWEAEKDLSLRRLDLESNRDRREFQKEVGKFLLTTAVAAIGGAVVYFTIDLVTLKQQIAGARWAREQQVLSQYLNVDDSRLEAGERLLGFMCATARKDAEPELREWACTEKTAYEAHAGHVRDEKEKQAAVARAQQAAQMAAAKGKSELVGAASSLEKAREELRVARLELANSRQRIALPEARTVSDAGAVSVPPKSLTLENSSIYRGKYCIASSQDKVNYCFSETLEACQETLASNKKKYPDTTKDDQCIARPEILYCYLWRHTSGSVLQSCAKTTSSCESDRRFTSGYSQAREVQNRCEGQPA